MKPKEVVPETQLLQLTPIPEAMQDLLAKWGIKNKDVALGDTNLLVTAEKIANTDVKICLVITGDNRPDQATCHPSGNHLVFKNLSSETLATLTTTGPFALKPSMKAGTYSPKCLRVDSRQNGIACIKRIEAVNSLKLQTAVPDQSHLFILVNPIKKDQIRGLFVPPKTQ